MDKLNEWYWVMSELETSSVGSYLLIEPLTNISLKFLRWGPPASSTDATYIFTVAMSMCTLRVSKLEHGLGLIIAVDNRSCFERTHYSCYLWFIDTFVSYLILHKIIQLSDPIHIFFILIKESIQITHLNTSRIIIKFKRKKCD